MDSRAQALGPFCCSTLWNAEQQGSDGDNSVLMGMGWTFPWGVYKWGSSSRESRVRGQERVRKGFMESDTHRLVTES